MSDQIEKTAETVTDKPDPEALGAVLREYLVRCGSPEARTLLAERLAEEGLTPERLRLLCETVESRGHPEAETAAHCGQILKTQTSWTEFVEDAEYAAASRAARGGARRGGGQGKRTRGPVNMPDPETERERVRADMEGYVRTRVRDDGKTPEFMADHLNKPLETILRILEAT